MVRFQTGDRVRWRNVTDDAVAWKCAGMMGRVVNALAGAQVTGQPVVGVQWDGYEGITTYSPENPHLEVVADE